MRESISVSKHTGWGLIKETLLSIHSLLWLEQREILHPKPANSPLSVAICPPAHLDPFKSQEKKRKQQEKYVRWTMMQLEDVWLTGLFMSLAQGVADTTVIPDTLTCVNVNSDVCYLKTKSSLTGAASMLASKMTTAFLLTSEVICIFLPLHLSVLCTDKDWCGCPN